MLITLSDGQDWWDDSPMFKTPQDRKLAMLNNCRPIEEWFTFEERLARFSGTAESEPEE